MLEFKVKHKEITALGSEKQILFGKINNATTSHMHETPNFSMHSSLPCLLCHGTSCHRHVCRARLSWALGAALTHVQLPDEAGHVVVLEILGQHLFGKAALVEHMEAGAILQRR